MDPIKTIQNEIEAIDRLLDLGGLSSADTIALIVRKNTFRDLLWFLEGRDPTLCFWYSNKNREEATIEHNRRVTRELP